MTNVSEVLPASIIRATFQRGLLPPSSGCMMEAVSTSEMSVNFYQTTRRNIPEDSHLHNRRLENLKTYLKTLSLKHNNINK
jgi:hypothetical protein